MGRAQLSRDPDPVFLARAISHSLHVHGDRSPHADCAECRHLTLECLHEKGLTVEDIHELIDAGVPERHSEGAQLFLDMFPKHGYRGSAWD